MRDKVLIIDPFYTHLNIPGNSALFFKIVFSSSFDYLVLREDPLNKRKSLREFIDYLKQQETEFHRFYTEVKQFILPDGSQAVIYKRSALYGSGT
jgi:hypothetical protein